MTNYSSLIRCASKLATLINWRMIVVLMLLASTWNIVHSQSSIEKHFKVFLDNEVESTVVVEWSKDLPFDKNDCDNWTIEINRLEGDSYKNIHFIYFDNRPPYNGIARVDYFGPSTNFQLEIIYKNDCGVNEAFYREFTTPPIKAPSQVAASMVSETAAEITWKKETGLETYDTQYLIKRNGEEVARVAGDLESYIDTTIAPGTINILYTVQTIVGPDAPRQWKRLQSSEVQAPALNFRLEATTDESNRIKL